MKKILSFFALGYSIVSFAQLQVHTLNLVTNDLVYDAVTNKIYASVPSASGSNGNSIGIIDPNTYLLLNTVYMGSEPTVLAISDNGQYIYSGFSGASLVRRFIVATQTADLQFTLGNDPSTGSLFAEDIEVMPGQPTTIAVSRKNNGFSPRHEGVVIYDNNIIRSISTPDHTGSNRIEFTGPNALVGFNNETTEFGIRKMTVNASGVTNTSVTQNVVNNFYLDFIFKNNIMYFSDGSVVDVSGIPFVIGQFTNTSGPAAYDTYNNYVCFASYDYNNNIVFKRYNPNNFLLVDNLPITQAAGTVKNIITCGNGCYAFNTSDDKVIIIKDASLGTLDTMATNSIKIFPNPTSDFLYIQSKSKITSVTILDISGRTVQNVKNNFDKISIANLSNGTYLVKIMDSTGSMSVEKIIKN